MKFNFTIIFLILINYIGVSQNCKLQGVLLDSISNSPISYANITVRSKTDSIFLKGTVSDDNGSFSVSNLKEGVYFLNFSFIGYKTKILDEIKLNSSKRNYMKIKLVKASRNIGDVNIIGKSSSLRFQVDKKIIDASSFPSASVAMDLLENIPSLEVDVEGKLTYRGDGTFQVLVNGLAVSNGQEKLKTITSNRIKKIELITNPSAKYDAEGTAGIINIVLKKNRLEGYGINISTQISTLGQNYWNFDIDKQNENGSWYFNASLGKQVFNKSTFYSLRNSKVGNDMYSVVFDLDKKAFSKTSYLEFGFNYDLSDNDIVDFSINLNPFKSKQECSNSNGEITERYFKGSKLLSEKDYDYTKSTYTDYQYIGTSLKYIHSFNKDRSHILSGDIQYSRAISPFFEKNINIKRNENDSQNLELGMKEDKETSVDVNVFYENKLGSNSSFTIGSKLNYNYIPEISSVDGKYSEQGIFNPFSNQFKDQLVKYRQNIYSLYSSFKSKIGKFEYQLGVRSERLDMHSSYMYKSKDNKPMFKSYDSNYMKYFPSVHTMYNFSETTQLALNYSKRIRRPRYWQIVGLSRYSSPYSFFKGNGNIKPSLVDALQLSYKKSWDRDFIGIELFSYKMNDVIQSYSRTSSTNVFVNTPENVGESLSIGTQLMMGKDLFSWWNINFSTSLFSYSLETNVDNIKTKKSQFRYYFRLNNSFVLPQKFTFKLNTSYRSSTITAQNKCDAYFYSNLSLKKSFKDRNWQVIMAWINVFDSIKYSSENTGSNFNISNDNYTKPYVSLKIIYNFNNQK